MTRRFACPRITRLDPATGHQTQVLTTRTDADLAPLAYAMFSRWCQKNWVRRTGSDGSSVVNLSA